MAQQEPETGKSTHTRARDPRVESIYGGVTERNNLPVSDPYRFTVNILPHLYFPRLTEYLRTPCAWCPFTRVHPVHPEER